VNTEERQHNGRRREMKLNIEFTFNAHKRPSQLDAHLPTKRNFSELERAGVVGASKK
jgi:hypothetical protein